MLATQMNKTIHGWLDGKGVTAITLPCEYIASTVDR